MSSVLDDSFSRYALKILHILSYYDDILNFNLCFLLRVIFKMTVVLGCYSLYPFLNDLTLRIQLLIAVVVSFVLPVFICSVFSGCFIFFPGRWGLCFCFVLSLVCFFPKSVNGDLCSLAHL